MGRKNAICHNCNSIVRAKDICPNFRAVNPGFTFLSTWVYCPNCKKEVG